MYLSVIALLFPAKACPVLRYGAGIQKSIKSHYVYMLASKRNVTLYIGVTNDLIRRVFEHKQGLVEGFTKRYNVNQLVFFEETNDVESAIIREKQIKRRKRQWKIELIEKNNPEWKDLYSEMAG